jgi:VanZ family protein
MFINQFLTSLGMGADFRYTYEFSLLGVLLCMLISAASAVTSTYMPYHKWKNERVLLAKKHLGE